MCVRTYKTFVTASLRQDESMNQNTALSQCGNAVTNENFVVNGAVVVFRFYEFYAAIRSV